MTVTKDTNCGCCGAWVEHIEAAGFPVSVVESSEVESLKQRLGVPAALYSCHTAEVDGYVIEGHVPAAALRRLLAARPLATGLAVPGMPAGSPAWTFPAWSPSHTRCSCSALPSRKPSGVSAARGRSEWNGAHDPSGRHQSDPEPGLRGRPCLCQELWLPGLGY